MKKLFAVILTVALLLTFAACGKVGETKKEFSRGVITGNAYENEFLGLGVELGDDWVFYSDEQIATLYGFTTDLLEEDFGEYLKNATVIYDMHAANNVDASNIGINFEKLSVLGEVQTANMEVYLTSVMPTVVNSLETIGCTDVSYELCDVKIGDNTFKGAKTKATMSGIQLYQMIVCTKCDGYIANITVTSYLTDTTQSILDRFYSLK